MRNNQEGSVTYISLIVAFVLAAVLALVIEFCYLMTVRAHMQGTMESTLETVVELWTIDEYRSDEQLYISEEAAMDSYRGMLAEALRLNRDGYRQGPGGEYVWSYDELDFQCTDNGIWVSGRITVWPLLMGKSILRGNGTAMEVEASAYINYNR